MSKFSSEVSTNILLALPLVGCSKEQLADSSLEVGIPVEMRVKVSTPAGNSVANAEDAVNRIRLVVFGSMGSPDAGSLIMNKFYSTPPAANKINEIITSGKRDIYIIVNEPVSGGNLELDSYKNISTVEDVRKLALIYQGAGSATVYSPTEIPMFISHVNKQILVDSPNEISGNIERTMAKVTMKLNVKHSDFPTGEHVVIDNITIKNLPSQSYWVSKNYSDALVASEKQSVKVVTPESGYDFSSNNTFYVPEYIFNNPDNGAYIEIVGYVNGNNTRVCKWIVKLGDAMDDAGKYGDKYNITRNHHYTFVGDVKSYGEMGDLAVKVTVMPWNTVNMDEDMGRYVAFDKVTNASDVVIADGGNLSDIGETIKVSCITNVGGWYIVVENAKGKEVHRSTPTAVVTSETTQSVSFVIPKLNAEPYLQSYTIGVYHARVAQEAIGPAKEFKLTQYGGFIPNSVLQNAGWPVDKLPVSGLQVAMRGDKQMPGSGTAAMEDPEKPWKTEMTTTAGVERVTDFANAQFAMGKSNTDAMVATSALVALHPAAQYCRDMGPEWYLPSIKELRLIYDNRNLLASNYSFTTSVYWSATDYSDSGTWYVVFNNGNASTRNKTSANYVRCVRDI